MTTDERLKAILANEYNLPEEKLVPDARLDELGIDSLGVMELLFKVEEEFNIQVPADQVALATVADVVGYIDRLIKEQTGVASSQATS